MPHHHDFHFAFVWHATRRHRNFKRENPTTIGGKSIQPSSLPRQSSKCIDGLPNMTKARRCTLQYVTISRKMNNQIQSIMYNLVLGGKHVLSTAGRLGVLAKNEIHRTFYRRPNQITQNPASKATNIPTIEKPSGLKCKTGTLPSGLASSASTSKTSTSGSKPTTPVSLQVDDHASKTKIEDHQSTNLIQSQRKRKSVPLLSVDENKDDNGGGGDSSFSDESRRDESSKRVSARKKRKSVSSLAILVVEEQKDDSSENDSENTPPQIIRPKKRKTSISSLSSNSADIYDSDDDTSFEESEDSEKESKG